MIPRTVPTPFRDRHTISAEQTIVLLESTYDATPTLKISDTTCCSWSSQHAPLIVYQRTKTPTQSKKYDTIQTIKEKARNTQI